MPPFDPASRRRAELSATIIFAPREMKHFRRWQLQTQSYHDADSIGHLPSALEYCAFKSWREEQKRVDTFPDPFRWGDELAAHMSPPATPHSAPLSPPLSECGFGETAKECGHLLHPGIPAKEQARCPPCIIEAHLQYMDLLTKNLDSLTEKLNLMTKKLKSARAGTMHRQSKVRQSKKDAHHRQQLSFEAWYCGKLDMAQAVHLMQDWAAYEEDWLQDGMDSDLKDARSAHEALMMYWQTIDNAIPKTEYQLDSSDSEVEPSSKKVKRRDSGSEKKVEFANDTCFNEGRDQAYFRKDGPRYEPKSPTSVDEEEIPDQEDANKESANQKEEATLIEFDHSSDQDDEFSDQASEGDRSDYSGDGDSSYCTDDEDNDEDGDWCSVDSDLAIDDDTSFIVFE